MNRELFWKNFNLGTELEISGNFIYDALKAFSQLEALYYEDEIFGFLYNVSVGIERLEKIAIILIEHDYIKDQETFEKSLITHSHLDLLSRIKQKYDLKLGKYHNTFIQLLGRFYKTIRYDRYNLGEVECYDKEKQAIRDYISDSLNIQFDNNELFLFDENIHRIKKFIGKIVGKISSELYGVIRSEAQRLNIYTYELRSDSKAYKIFIRKEYDFLQEEILWKELFVFLLNNKEQKGVIEFIRNIEPLEFDSVLASEYMRCFQDDLSKLQHMDELEALYEELEDTKERFEMMKIIGQPGICFDIDHHEDIE